MKFAKPAALVACSVAAALLATAADAKPRKRQHYSNGDVIVVHPRAFTDSGVVVPVGSRSNYVNQMTIYNKQPLQAYSPDLLWKPWPDPYYPVGSLPYLP